MNNKPSITLYFRYKCNLCSAAFRLQAQLREHYRIHYDVETLRSMEESQEEKPQMSQIEMLADQQRVLQQYQSIIKNEKELE